MGDILAHRRVYTYVITKLVQEIPDEEYTYLALGNFLTDLDQVRDPFSYFLAKTHVYHAVSSRKVQVPIISPITGKVSIPILGPPIAYLIAKEWMDDLLGKHIVKRHGSLALFLTHFEKFMVHQFFSSDSPTHIGRSTHFAPIPPDELNVVLDQIDVNSDEDYPPQYYPHEHLDRPPLAESPNHRQSSLYQRQNSGLIGYLEEQIQYISEELTRVELGWLTNRDRAPANRRDILLRLGHVLHAVEDYFFHTNFVEIYQWRSIQLKYPNRRANKVDYDWLLLHSLEGTPYDQQSVQLRRRLARRLRYPMFIREIVPDVRFCHKRSRDNSEDGSEIVFTGGFAGNDMYHTLHAALTSIERAFVEGQEAEQQLGVSTNKLQEIRHNELVLLRVIFNEEERRKMVEDESHEQRLIELHKEQLLDGKYEEGIERLLHSGFITSDGAIELRMAFEVDKTLEQKGDVTPGVGGFLISFLAELQKNVDESDCQANHLNNPRDSPNCRNKQLILNRPEDSILHIGTDNGASVEDIGTHSLLAKDSKSKQPFVEEATALAQHASTSIATLMVKRINDDHGAEFGLDWDSILRHYLRFPNSDRGSWEESVISALAVHQPIPTVSEVSDQPNFRLLGPGFESKKLTERRNGDKTRVLKQRYHNLEAKVDF
jgi:hypothetical protein